MFKNTMEFTVNQDTKISDIISGLNDFKIKYNLVDWDINQVVACICQQFYKINIGEYKLFFALVGDSLHLVIKHPQNKNDVIYQFNIPKVFDESRISINKKTLLMVENQGPVTIRDSVEVSDKLRAIESSDGVDARIISRIENFLNSLLTTPRKSFTILCNRSLVPSVYTNDRGIRGIKYQQQYSLTIESVMLNGECDKFTYIVSSNKEI